MDTKTYLIRCALSVLLAFMPLCVCAQQSHNNKETMKAWQSMENGPWDFAPSWYNYWLHKDHTGAETYWKWSGFKSGLKVRFKENKSNVKRIMPVRVISMETQVQKAKKVEDERADMEQMFNEETLRAADRNVDLMYPSYKDEFEQMQESISDGLMYCLEKSKGDLADMVDELSRQNAVLCEHIAYIHKQGVGYELENSERQEAYEEAKAAMKEIMDKTFTLTQLAVANY